MSEPLRVLNAIDMAFGGSVDLHSTLETLLERVVTRLSVHAACVLLLSPETGTLVYAAGRGFCSSDIEQSNVRLGEGTAGRAVLQARLMAVPNIDESDIPFAREHLLAGEGFVANYAVPLITQSWATGVLEVFHRAPLKPLPEWIDLLEAFAGQAAIAIDNAWLIQSLHRSSVELASAYDATIEGWSRALDLRDKETGGHTQRVTEATLELARAFHVEEEELVHIKRGALLHDIGKMGIPDGILVKPGALTDEEWEVMRKHPTFAYQLLSPIPYLRPALDIPYAHHERWDGGGYPRGLKGEEIPQAARIFSVVDVWDALRSERPYRGRWPDEKVREHILEGSGTQFDPEVVPVFLKLKE